MLDKAEPWLVEDNGGPIKLYSDGSVVRAPNLFGSMFLTEHNNYGHVPYKDIVFDEETGLWARLYLSPETENRLPMVMYFHGGGFCMLSAASTLLAPEHRLPTAYNDSIAALRWMEREGAIEDPSLRSHADFSKIFLAGDSAEGNITHHVGVWAASKSEEIKIKIKGLILLYPFFGGEERTPSETEKGSSMLTA
ncbi:probable carboxylesterase 6 [Cryptomeria japonica]|uniref:probable carboxylesterase 6 n=1 Tax=Cryptomeria japonica TaxID=3369 RepID=UPI0027DA862D|nr:probable carboxylesterase 6 [Cryptomeria japonica]